MRVVGWYFAFVFRLDFDLIGKITDEKVGKKKGELTFAFQVLAEWTGLEPATPGVTGRYSNQLNYHSKIYDLNLFLLAFKHTNNIKTKQCYWWVLTGSNRRHSACKADALPTELSTRRKTATVQKLRVFSKPQARRFLINLQYFFRHLISA